MTCWQPVCSLSCLWCKDKPQYFPALCLQGYRLLPIWSIPIPWRSLGLCLSLLERRVVFIQIPFFFCVFPFWCFLVAAPMNWFIDQPQIPWPLGYLQFKKCRWHTVASPAVCPKGTSLETEREGFLPLLPWKNLFIYFPLSYFFEGLKKKKSVEIKEDQSNYKLEKQRLYQWAEGLL